MKLRIKGNSIRLRLTRGEVSKFAANSQVEDSISFGRGRLLYALASSAEAEKISADFADGRIAIIVPKSIAEQWTQTAQVGFDAAQNLPDGETLKILVEKDFACSETRAGEDDADAFPRPSGETGPAC